MSSPELIELSRADFVTIDTIGPPGERTFYLQASQDDLLITLVIEKMHAAALSVAIKSLLERLGQAEEPASVDLNLIQPVEPLFRAGNLGLGYDEERDLLVIVAEEMVTGEDVQAARVQIWADRLMMAQLAHQAATVVAAGRPTCPLCNEPINPGEDHTCVRGNGRKKLYGVE